MNKQTGRRLLASALTVCMLLGLLAGVPGLVTTTRAAGESGVAAEGGTKDAYGFDTSRPDGFDEGEDKGVNPYGSAAITGHVNFNAVRELGIYESAAYYEISKALNLDRSGNMEKVFPSSDGSEVYSRNNSLLTGTVSGGNNAVTHFEHGAYGRLKYVRGVAYDPTGSGRDDYVAYYGYGNNSENKAGAGNTNRPGMVYFKATGAGSNAISYLQGRDESSYAWMNSMASFKADGYNAMVAGDFNGDGKDTLIFYDPALGNLTLQQIDGTGGIKTAKTAIDLGNDAEIGGRFGWDEKAERGITLNEIQTANNKDSAICRNTAMVHLAAGDLDGDNKDELVVTISLGDLDAGRESELHSTASIVVTYDYEGDRWGTTFILGMGGILDENRINSSDLHEGWFLRSAASAIGDVNGDGTPEIVVVGNPARFRRNNSDDVGNAQLLFTVLYYDGNHHIPKSSLHETAGGIRVELTVGQYLSNSNTSQFGDWASQKSGYADNPPISVGCVQLEGFGSRPYVFVQGHIFRYEEDDTTGALQFTPTQYWGSTKNETNTDRYLQDMTYVSQPVIANFDGNTNGRQQVFFVVGTRGSNDYNWIIGLAGRGRTETIMNGRGLLSCDWNTNVINRDPKYSSCVALTAPDVDTDDGLLARYIGKEYTYTEPEIMAILEASPYFEDLVDEYPDTSGATTFGRGTGSAEGLSQSASTSAGAYVSFEQEFSFLGIKAAKVEMEASYAAEWSKETEMTTEYSYDMEFEIGRNSNQVLLIRTPVIVYNYQVTGPSGQKSVMSISEPKVPAYHLLPIERYNELAKQLGNPVIDSDIVSAIPGQPDTYRTNITKGMTNAQTLDHWNSVGGGGNSTMTQSITKTDSNTVTTSLTHNIDAKAGGGAGGFTMGATMGLSFGDGESVTDIKSISRSGTVASVPEEFSDNYDFSWKFVAWDTEIDGYTVPVLSYLVQNVKQPPSLPKNVEAVAETDSITLTWDAGFNSAAQYEVWRYLPNTDDPYYYVGAVLGSDRQENGRYQFEITGLTPGLAYHYCLRAVEEGKYSAYTEPLTVVTASEGDNLPRIIEEPKDGNVLPGGTASFSIQAFVKEGRPTYSWQVRPEGRIAWEKITNAKSANLTLSNVTEDMDGNQYRCQVSLVSNSSEDPVFVYSKAATLHVGKEASTTTVTAQTTAGGNGGSAGYTIETPAQQTVTKYYRVTTPTETKEYYTYENSDVYYCMDDGGYYLLTDFHPEAAVAVEGQPGMFAAPAAGRTALTNLQNALVQEGEGGAQTRITSLEKLRSTQQKTEKIGGIDYNVFTAQGVAVTGDAEEQALFKSTLTLYQQAGAGADAPFYVDINAGQRGESGEALEQKLEAIKPAPSDDVLENLTYFDSPEPVWSDEYEEDEGYTVLTFGDGAINLYRKTEDGTDIYYTRTSTPGEDGGNTNTYTALTLIGEQEGVLPLGAVSKNGVISSRINHNMEAAIETTPIDIVTMEPQDGDKVTLTAAVSAGTGKVIFKLVNTTTGTSQTVEGVLSGGTVTVAWTPATAGVYQITASYQGDNDTMPSSGGCTYYAYVDPNTREGYRLELADTVPYGGEISPKLVKWVEADGTIGEEVQTVEITSTAHAFLGIGAADESGAALADEAGYSIAPVPGWPGNTVLSPGDYLIRAAWGAAGRGDTSSTPITVTKREVEITAPANGLELPLEKVESFDLAQYLPQVTVAKNSILLADAAAYGGAEQGYPLLLCLTGGPKPEAGSFDIHVGYAAEEAGNDATEVQREQYEDFLSKYLPSFQKSVVSVKANTVDVDYEVGSNGRVYARADDIPFDSGAAVPVNSTLLFVAEPDTDYVVSHWTIDGEEVTEKTSGVELTPEQDALTVRSVTKPLSVGVVFTNKLYSVNFSSASEAEGTVSASTMGADISTGARVVGGRNVTFTAQPAENFVVKSWTVNDEVKINDDTTVYSGNTLTVENLSETITVKVDFEEYDEFSVGFTAVDEALQELSSGVSLGIKGLNEKGEAAKGSTITLTAVPTVGNAVQEWQAKWKSEAVWETVAPAQESYTIHNLQGDMDVRVVVSNRAVTYPVTFGVDDVEGAPLGADAGGKITATVNGQEISSGSNQPNISRVVFRFTAAPDYEFVRWEAGGEDVGHESREYVIESLTAAADIRAVVQKKPQVTIRTEPAAGGEVTAMAADQPVESGDYVYNNTELIFTAAPSEGYRVKSWTVNGVETPAGDPADTDDQTFTAVAAGSVDVEVTVVFEEIPTYEITYSVHEVEPGRPNGALTVEAERKGMEIYERETVRSGDRIHEGSIVTFTAEPKTGYRVKAWTYDGTVLKVDGVEDENAPNYISPTLKLPDLGQAHKIIVEFVQNGSKVTFSAWNGALSAQHGSSDFESGGIISAGAIVKFTAKPHPGYELKEWTVNGETQKGETGLTFTYTAPKQGDVGADIRAIFQQIPYPVSWRGESHGQVTSGGEADAAAEIRGGTAVSFTAIPDEGYILDYWTVNGVKVTDGLSDNTLTWQVPNGTLENTPRYDVKAFFKGDSFTLNYEQPANGQLTAAKGDGDTIIGGEQIAFTATPEDGYQVADWIVNDVPQNSNSRRLTVTVKGDTRVSVQMVADTHKVTFFSSPEDGGKVTADNGNETGTALVEHGKTISLVAKAEQYFDLVRWLVDDQPVDGAVGEPLVLPVTKNMTVEAVFEKQISFDVDFSVVNGNGSLSAKANGEPFMPTPETGGQPVEAESTLEFVAKPDQGQMVKGWTVTLGENGPAIEITRDTDLDALGITMRHHLDNTLTVESLNKSLEVQVEFEAYQGFDIPTTQASYEITDADPNPKDSYEGAPDTEVRRDGDLTFTIGAAKHEGYVVMDHLVVNGYDCIAGKPAEDGVQPDNCVEVTATKNSDGSYKVTIIGVTGDIDLDAEARELVITEGLDSYTIPEALQKKGYTESSQIVAKLETELVGSKNGMAIYDIVLKYWDAVAGDWIDVTEENFPKDGVDVRLEYPDGSQRADTFTVLHMLTTSKDAGNVVPVSHEKKADGLHFHVTSLSPFAVGWTTFVPSNPGGGTVGGGYAVTLQEADHGTVKASRKTAEEGDKVLLTVQPDAGYTLGLLLVNGQSGKAVKVTEGTDDYTFLMPAEEVTVQAIFYTEAPWVNPFTDVAEDAWYYEAVKFAHQTGLTTGTSETLFSPEMTTSRGMVVTLLYRLEGAPNVKDEAWRDPYADVDATAFYAPAVYWARQKGIANGYGDGSFGPNDPVTREQLAVILHNYVKYKGLVLDDQGDLTQFTDGDSISGWARESLAWGVGTGLFQGYDGKLAPTDTATRAELFQLILNFFEKIYQR